MNSKITEQVALFDDEALAALGNKGLLRRAQKDIEKGVQIKVDSDAPDGLHITVGSCHVRIPESGPAQATCSCPSVSICQHILAACLFLRRQASSASPEVSGDVIDGVRKELLGYSADTLAKWAGKKAFNDAVATLRTDVRVEVEEKGVVTVRIPDLNVECRYGPSGGLEGLIVSDGTADIRKAGVLAILAYQQFHGVKLEVNADEAARLTDVQGAPRSRQEILSSTDKLLDEVLQLGLSHGSESLAQRASTLAVSALGVNLPRLSLALRAVADETRLICKRDAKANESALLSALGRVHALSAALQASGENPAPALVGWHRTRYDEIGHLELHGLGAYQWTTRSGYDGLTVILWDNAGKRWQTWSESRPRHLQQDFKPSERYKQDGPWSGAASPEHISKGHFKLMKAKRNPAGRLSASAKSQAIALGMTEPETLDFGSYAFDSWAELRAHVSRQTPIGLNETGRLSDVVVLRPKHWGPPRFDSTLQVFSMELEDDKGDVVKAVLPFNEMNEPAIKFLERMDIRKQKAWSMVGKAWRQGFSIEVFPVSILCARGKDDSAVLNPFFDGEPLGKSVWQRIALVVRSDEEEEWTSDDDEERSGSLQHSLLDQCLTQMEDALLVIAEAGCAHVPELTKQRVGEAAKRAKRLGLPLIGEITGGLATAGTMASADVLKASYLCQMHRQAALRL